MAGDHTEAADIDAGGRRRRDARGRRREGESGTPTASEAANPSSSSAARRAGGSAGAPRRTLRRQYKIQEVIKRRQMLLVQVVKEERGNKGAALTTYLSLAGRYSVLMPNTARGGGISRKITNAADRKRLKDIVRDLEVPQGMGIILRTAGASRTKAEVKRDFEYLLRLWESVRELTLQVDRAVPRLRGRLADQARHPRPLQQGHRRDSVAGDDGYREAKDFMRMLMPSHAKNVQLYKEPTPLFAQFGVEAQLDAMFSPQVTLPSGGYIVINPTEALVSIDVNSGRATREHNIEDTALKTNLEAAEEVARQLRLRDLAGLIVIDFIDMEENRNNRAVEKRLKDASRTTARASRSAAFQLSASWKCAASAFAPACSKARAFPARIAAAPGSMRSTPSIALHVLRSLEDSLIRSATHDLA